MPAGPQRVDHGVLGCLLELPQARHPAGRALRRPGSRAAAPRRTAKTYRRPGRPADRHRPGNQARAGGSSRWRGIERRRGKTLILKKPQVAAAPIASNLEYMTSILKTSGLLAGGVSSVVAAA